MASKHLEEIRQKKGKDHSPKWDGCESWDSDLFHKRFTEAMAWYRLEYNGRDLKPHVLHWMRIKDYPVDQIRLFKDSKDWRCNGTMGAIAACLLKGMISQRNDFNGGRNTEDWLRSEIAKVLQDGKNDLKSELLETTVSVPKINIQDRLREVSSIMVEEIDQAVDSFVDDPESFDHKAFKILNLLKGKQAKAAHARIIKDFYSPCHIEITEALQGKCEQLKEAYSHFNKKQMKKLQDFYAEIITACDMLMQEQKINRKPRAKKSVSKDKLISKLKFAKTHEPLKLVSINPSDIIGSKELWVFNYKTRKLGKYVADEFTELSIKGTSIIGFNETNSIQKTLRKPEEQLKEFKSAGKVALRKFLEDIKSVDIKLNGRINEDTLLLKVQ
jgi:hypothetical protein